MRKWLVGLALLVPVVASGQSSRWVRIAEAADKSVLDEYDTVTVTRTGSTVNVWIRRFLAAPQKTDTGALYDIDIMHEELSCTTRSMRFLSMVQKMGETVVNNVNVPSSWVDTVPETVQEGELTVLCAATQPSIPERPAAPGTPPKHKAKKPPK